MQELVEKLTALLIGKKLMLASAESCTGGMIAAAMTDRAGSSAVFERGFVTYSNDSKMELLGVPAQTLLKHGAVSAQTAAEMAAGALKFSRAHIAVSVTGIAGPSGGTLEKPVGLVHIGYGARDNIKTAEHHFKGDRAAIRKQTVESAIKHLMDFLQ